MYQTTLYNAFSGISPPDQSNIIRFLLEHSENDQRKSIEEAMEYALKNKPSFGGFVLTAQLDQTIVATIVANRTGMAAYSPGLLFAYAAIAPSLMAQKQLVEDFIRKAINLSDGEIAMHLKPSNPILSLFQQFGFASEYLELRLSKNASAAV